MIESLLDSKENELLYFGISLSKNIVEQESIKKKLFKIWDSGFSDYKTRREVMWRILDIKNLSIEIHNSIYNFVLVNWNNWTKDTLVFYGGAENVLKAVSNRSTNPSFIEDKHWVYLCLATLSPNKAEAKKIISKYLQSKVTINAKVARDMIKKIDYN